MTGASGFFRCLAARWKQAARLLPALLLTAALLLAAGGLYLRAGLGDGSENRMLRVALTGETEDDPLLRAGLELLEAQDGTRFILTFFPMEEAEALQKLDRGEVDAVLAFPAGFVRALMEGREGTQLRLTVPAAASGLGAALTEELARLGSELLSQAERSVYTLQDVLAEELPDTDPYAAGDALAESYLHLLLDREELFAVETAGLSRGLDSGEYYLCAGTVLLLSFFGLAAAPLAGARSNGLNRLLAASGLPASGQCAAELIAWLGVLLPAFAVLWLSASALLTYVPALGGLLPDASGAARYALRALFPALMLAAGQLLLIELAAGALDGLLLEFLAAGVLGFAGGCFYPISFFPAFLEKLGAALPTGAALRWTGAPDLNSGLLVGAYLIVFFFLTALLRQRRLEGGGT